MFKVNNKEYVTSCSSVFIVNFEQENTAGEEMFRTLSNTHDGAFLQ